MLDHVNLLEPPQAPQIWEKVITKLSLRAMPPVGMPRPDETFYVSFIQYLQEQLDQLAEENPDPGNTVNAHRLNRTEYTNAIRDLLGVEIEGNAMLPPDNSGGFDNLAELLSVSQLLMEKYISVGRHVSRLAIGDITLPVDSVQYTIDPKLLQQDRMDEDLPFGSRGGFSVRHRFPLDGEYELSIRLLRSDQETLIIGLAEPHQLDVRIDGRRIKLFTIGGEHVGLAQDGPTGPEELSDPLQAQYERTADEKLKVRFPMQAGTHSIQVTFLDDDFAWEAFAPRPAYEYFNSRLGNTAMRQWVEPSISNVTINGPYNINGAGETISRKKIFTCFPDNVTQEISCARKILSNLVRLAYRRPVNDTDIDPLLGLFEQGRDESGSFELGIEQALEGMLGSPGFLFRIERTPQNVDENDNYTISDIALASRLSFFLWSSIPDDKLLTLAEQGKLSDPTILEGQVRRMLADKRANVLVNNFAEQWLLTRNLPQIHKNNEVFPEFDERLREDFYQELSLFVGSVFIEDLSVLDLFRADYSYLNERLAKHYGVKGVYGNRFRKVVLPESQRGLLSRAGILSITSYPNRNSTVLRGKWVLENILASPPPPPPEDIPLLEDTKGESGETLTLRERMEIHPANPACAVCHNQMDPIGFGLENFDAIGQWRSEDEGKPINAKGKLPSGIEFEGPAELQAALLETPDVIAGAFTQKLMTYALGRPLEYFDKPAVRKILKNSKAKDYQFSAIVLGIVNSIPFRMRRAGR